MRKGKQNSILIWIFAILLALASALPYFAMNSGTPSGSVYMGSIGNGFDQASYLAWIKQGAEGKLLFSDNYTTEPQSGAFFHPFFLVCGWFVRLTGLEIIQAYHIIRSLLAILFIMMLFKFSELFLQNFKERFFFTALSALSAGFSFMFSPKILEYLNSTFLITPYDLIVPEATAFMAILHKPLFLMALILLLSSMFFLYRGFKNMKGKDILLSILMLFLLGFVHPYDLATVYITLVLYLIWTRADWMKWRLLAGIVVISCPSLIYEYLMSSYDPVFREWGKTLTISSTPWSYFLSFGFVFIAAAAYTAKRWGKYTKTEIFLLSWLIGHFILAYFPVRFERRLILGFQIPLALLATMWFYSAALPFLRKHLKISPRGAVAFAAVAIALTFPSNLRFIYEEVFWMKGNPANYCVLITDREAFSWMDKNIPADSVVLSSFASGIYIPGLAGCKVYAGHYDQTVNSKQKKREAGYFYETATKTGFRKSLIELSRAEYVYCGGFERAIGDAGLDSLSELEKIYENSGAAVYKVRGKLTDLLR
ncbi:MAG: hypothetical protein WCI43_07575 [Candidatus Firestonebacteria bacterium]